MRSLAPFATLAFLLIAVACSEEPAATRLELSETQVLPGQRIEMRVIVPGEHLYDMDAVVERLDPGGRWTPTHHVALSETGGTASSARYGDPHWAIFLMALIGDRPWTIGLPRDLRPGRYRIAKDVTPGPLAPSPERVEIVIRSPELVVTA